MTLLTPALRATLLASVSVASVTLIMPAIADNYAETQRTELFRPGTEHVATEHVTAGPATTGDMPPLIAGLGSYGMTITTTNPLAQAYFDQGLGLVWGFNHAEAVRAFRAAQAIDPDCAMCAWGEAFALGPNLNDGMHAQAEAPAWEAVNRAASLAGSEREQQLIAALQTRYAPPGEGDRAALDAAFAAAMAAVAGQLPEDANVLVLAADALMNTQPWDYWEADGVTPKGAAGTILATLEGALEIAPDHPAALHLYIHAVEASTDPGLAEAAADRLRGAAPSAGHLVHMPAHIYNRIGRYADSIAVNIEAIAADEAFLAQAGDAASPLYRFGYYPHNVHYLLVSAQMAGLEDVALETAEKLAAIPLDVISSDYAWVQAIETAPYTARAQFSDPAAVLALPDPGDEFPFVKGFWHYARGVAFAAIGDTEAAGMEVAAIEQLIAEADMSDLEAQYLPARDVLGIAKHVVEGRIEQALGNWHEASTLR